MDIIVIVIIGLVNNLQHRSSVRSKKSYPVLELLSIDDDIRFLGMAYTLLSSYALIVIIHAFSYSYASSDSFVEWIFSGIFFTLFFSFFELINIFINIFF